MCLIIGDATQKLLYLIACTGDVRTETRKKGNLDDWPRGSITQSHIRKVILAKE